MIEHEFNTYKELLEFIEDRRDDNRACYYWGFIENLNGELYSIADLEKDAEPDWFGTEDEYGKPILPCVYEFEIDPIYAVIVERKGDDEVIICNSKQHAMKEAKNEWDRLARSEKSKYVVRGVVRYVDYAKDTRTLIDEFYFDADEVDMENLTEKQKEIIVSGIYDEEIWNSYEWEDRDIYFKTEGGNWVRAFLDVEDALCEYESNWDEEEDGEFSDDTEVSLEVGQDKYGREWFAVAGPNQFTTTTVDGVRLWREWYSDEMIREVKLS